jgi:hypothetical protein
MLNATPYNAGNVLPEEDYYCSMKGLSHGIDVHSRLGLWLQKRSDLNLSEIFRWKLIWFNIHPFPSAVINQKLNGKKVVQQKWLLVEVHGALFSKFSGSGAAEARLARARTATMFLICMLPSQ